MLYKLSKAQEALAYTTLRVPFDLLQWRQFKTLDQYTTFNRGITAHQCPWHTPLQNSTFKLSQLNCSWGEWLASGHVIKLCVISATNCLCYVQWLGYKWVIILGDFSHMQDLGHEWVTILGFPSMVYLPSNWGRYLHCSHGWCSSDWRSQQL